MRFQAAAEGSGLEGFGRIAMPHYRVMLHGSGVDVAVDDSPDPIVGFYTARVVTAKSESEAERLAVENVLEQWSAGPYGQVNRGTVPRLTVESVEVTSWFDRLFRRGTGYVFYTPDVE